MKLWFIKIIAIFLFFFPRICLGKSLDIVEKFIDSYRLDQARKNMELLSPPVLNSPEGQFLLGKLSFFTGDNESALEYLQKAVEGNVTRLDWKLLRDQIRLSRDAEKKLIRSTMGKKGIEFYHSPGNDKILPSYGAYAIDQQRKTLFEELNDQATNVRVYILPDIEMLSALGGLTAEQIQSTGTVALTRYNRIMILSPQSIKNGYPWLDTLAHEYTHLIVSRLSLDRAPIWLHEAIAKLYEARWRGQEELSLTPEASYLLDRAAREKRLIPLRKFHPSVAFLPTQEDATLAYAQAMSFLSFLKERKKDENTILDLLKRLGNGESVDQAIKAVWGSDLTRLFRWWQENIAGVRQAPAVIVPLMKRQFQASLISGSELTDLVLDVEVRRHIRIGDLLLLRGHQKGAKREYLWALEKNNAPSPVIIERLAEVLIAKEEFDEADKLLQEVMDLYPYHLSSYVHMAQLKIVKNEYSTARGLLKKAIGINPFLSQVHCLFYQLPGIDENEKKIQKENCLFLRRSE